MNNISEKESKLIAFAKFVLTHLENQEEWNADTTDDIAKMAYHMELAETGEDGMFQVKK
jgi:hypothetical protein